MKGIPDENYTTQNLIRRRRRNEDINKQREDLRVKDVMMANRRKKQMTSETEIKDPEFFANRYRKQQKSYTIYKRKKNAVKSCEAPIAKITDNAILALRVKDGKKISKQESGLLARLNLTKKHNATFIENSVKNLKALKQLENYIVEQVL